jgi:archaellum component FlaC
MTGVITLSKRVDTDLASSPAVVFDIGCTTTQAARVRLRDELPPGFEVDDVVFFDDYHGEAWTTDGDDVVFEHPVEPDEELSTLFGVETSDPSSLQPFLSEPTIEMAPDGADGGGNWGVLSDDLIDVTIDESTAEDASLAEAAADGGDVSAAPVGGTAHLEATDSKTTGSEPTELVTTDGDDPVEQFLARLDGQTLTDQQRETLRSELGLESIASMDARLDHCQKQLSDLAAYVNALEAFIDEEGKGQQLIDSFSADLEAVESELAAVDDELDETIDEQVALRDRVDELEAAVGSLQGVHDDVADLEARLDESTDDLRAEIDDVRASVEELQQWQTGVVSAFEGLQSFDGA